VKEVEVEIVELGQGAVAFLRPGEGANVGLIFEGRYPFIGDADLPELISVLGRLPEFGAQTIVPGHGLLCGEAEIDALRAYYHQTWARTIDHLTQGHSADEAAADPGYPRYAKGAVERYHETNIRLVYETLVGGEACPL
jgi:hypothetical protein